MPEDYMARQIQARRKRNRRWRAQTHGKRKHRRRLAMTLFGDFTEVTTFDGDGKLNLDEMKRKTAECIDDDVENICEASFDYNGLYCAADILRKENGGYAIYEVKSSTKLKQYYFSHLITVELVIDFLFHC